MEVTIANTRGALAALQEEWATLAAPARSPLLDHAWFSSAAETLHEEADWRIVAVRERGALVAVAPLAAERAGSGFHLALLGASALYEPGGWLAASPAAMEQTLTAVLRLGLPVHLHRVAVDGGLPDAVTALTPARALARRRASAPSLAVETTGEWEQYYARLPGSITGNLPRVRRRAEREFGLLRVDQLEPVAEQVDALLEEFVAVERSGWKGARGSALADRPQLRRFFQVYCRRAAGRRQLRYSRLSFGTTVAAVEIAVEAYQRLWQLKIGYHASASAYYPGLHLTQASIQWAFTRRLSAYEFLGVAEPWERRWHPVERPFQTIVMYPLSRGGLLGAGRDFIALARRRVQRLAFMQATHD